MTDTAALIERLRRKFSFYRDPDNSARWIAHERHVDEDCVEAANALSHLTTPPLPEDIAGLFDTVEEYLGDTEHWELADDSTPDPTDAANSLHKLRATLRALAQENERLNGLVEEMREGHFWQNDEEKAALAQENAGLKTIAYQRWEIANSRIRELESERDNLKAEFAVAVKWHEQDAADYNELRDERDEWKMKYESEVRLVDSIEAERDAIRAKTIEDAAQTAEWFINIEKFTAL